MATFDGALEIGIFLGLFGSIAINVGLLHAIGNNMQAQGMSELEVKKTGEMFDEKEKSKNVIDITQSSPSHPSLIF